MKFYVLSVVVVSFSKLLSTNISALLTKHLPSMPIFSTLIELSKKFWWVSSDSGISEIMRHKIIFTVKIRKTIKIDFK